MADQDKPDMNGWAPPDPGLAAAESQPDQPPPVQPPPVQPPPVQPPPVQPQTVHVPYGPYGPPPADPYGSYGPGPRRQAPPVTPAYQPYPYQPYPAYPQQPYPRHRPQRLSEVPAPPGRPFHRLARTSLHRWWRPLVGTLLIVALITVVVLVVVIGAGIGYIAAHGPDAPEPQGDAMFGGPTGLLAFNLAVLAALTPCVLLAVRLVQRRPVGSVISVVGRLRWGWLCTCCGLAVGFCLVILVLSYGLSAISGDTSEWTLEWAGWDRFWVPALVILLLVPLQATGEEFAFRGWLLQGIAAWTLETRTGRVGRALSVVFRTPWPAIVISAAVFTSAHGYTGWAMFEIFCFGGLTGWLTVRTGGLEAGIALHVFNNLMGLLLVAASGRISEALEQGGMPWTAFVVDVIALGLFALAVTRVARRRRGPARVSP